MTVNEQQAQTLAGTFADVLYEWLDADEWAEMKLRNVTYGENVCASHDFCDANMAMHEAFKRALGREPYFLNPDDNEPHPEADADLALWNRTWDIAKAGWLTEGCENVPTVNQSLPAAARAS